MAGGRQTHSSEERVSLPSPLSKKKLTERALRTFFVEEATRRGVGRRFAIRCAPVRLVTGQVLNAL